MRKFHKTDGFRFEYGNIGSKVIKSSKSYRSERLRIHGYDRNQDKKTTQQKIRDGLEELSYSPNNP